jgi:hypothetical protein
MATRYAIAAGVWSNPAIWDGGVAKPTLTDDVYSNNFSVTINEDINVGTIRTTSNVSPAITAGGQFIVTGSLGTRNITLTSVLQGIVGNGTLVSTCPLLINSTSGMTVNVNSIFTTAIANMYVYINGNCTVNLTGNINNIPNTGFNITALASGGTTNYIGTASVNSAQSTYILATSYNYNVIGNISGNGTFIRLDANGLNLNLTGNITTTSSDSIFINSTAATITITGNLLSTSGACISSGAGLGYVTNLTINGNVTGGINSYAIVNMQSALAITTINGNIVNNGTRMAINVTNLRVSPSTSQTITVANSSGGTRVFYANSVSDMPAVTDVRNGVVYASGALVGTCNVPSPDSVASGVPVDNTLGTSVIKIDTLMANFSALIT